MNRAELLAAAVEWMRETTLAPYPAHGTGFVFVAKNWDGNARDRILSAYDALSEESTSSCAPPQSDGTACDSTPPAGSAEGRESVQADPLDELDAINAIIVDEYSDSLALRLHALRETFRKALAAMERADDTTVRVDRGLLLNIVDNLRDLPINAGWAGRIAKQLIAAAEGEG